MQMNPLTMMQMFNQIKGSNNPMGMMQQMFGNNPMFGRAMEMAQGKSPEPKRNCYESCKTTWY